METNIVKTNETISPSKYEKSSSPMQEQPSVYTYPDWASIQAYYGPGVPIPPPFFNASVAPGHPPHTYLWSPQPIIPPFMGPYAAIYPHGSVYSHPSAALMASPVNQEVPAKSSTSKEKVVKKSKMLGLSASVDISESAGCIVNGLSQSGEYDEEGSSDESNGNSESGGFKNKTNRNSTNIPNSDDRIADKPANGPANGVHGAELNAPPKISLGLSVSAKIFTEKSLGPIPHPNLTSAMDKKASGITGAKPDGAIVLPTSTTIDERELKREKRKQSNRESARRSRLRKQAETEELAIKVGTLTSENTTLRSEISRLTECSQKLRLENSSLMEKLKAQLIDNEGSPAIVLENLLSRLDSNARTDAVAAS